MTVVSFGTLAAALFFVFSTGAAHAVYKCGNVYQDRPCDEKGPQAHLTPGMRPAQSTTPAGAPAAAAAGSPFAAACARVGEEAQKVSWKREGGATREKQLAETPASANIIESVYRKRGSAPEIRAAVEAECFAEKQQAADTAAAIAALQAQQRAAQVSAPVSQSAPPPAAATSAAPTQKTAAAAGPSSSCPAWRSRMDTINAEFRQGGTAAHMESLHNRRRDVEKLMREGNC
ncbi:MAG: hypothetical protein ACAH21_09190 [Ramlibacter sp.]